MTKIIVLNVGGVCFHTSIETLRTRDSFFNTLVTMDPDKSEFFIDRDPMYFRYVLNWLRGVHILPEEESALKELEFEADFFCITDMLEVIRRTKARFSLPRTLQRISDSLREPTL